MERDDERRLAERIALGDVEARNELTASHLYLVGYELRRRYRRATDPSALESEGNLGLLRAAESYDGRGPFESHARPWIRQSMRRQWLRQHAVPIKHDRLAAIGRLRRFRREEQAHGRRPTVAEAAAHLGISERRVLEMMVNERSMAGDVPFDEADFPVEPRPDVAAEVASVVANFGRLTVAERIAVAMQFPLNGARAATEAEVARKLGVPRDAVADVTASGLARLRDLMER